MKIAQFTPQTNINSKPAFKRLIFHEDAKQRLENNDIESINKVAETEIKLDTTYNWDLHVKPKGSDNVDFYWTRQSGDKPIMQRYIYTYKNNDKDFKTINFSSENPDKKGIREFVEGFVTYNTPQLAQKCYEIMSKSAYTPLEKLDKFANVTLALDCAQKVDVSDQY